MVRTSVSLAAIVSSRVEHRGTYRSLATPVMLTDRLTVCPTMWCMTQVGLIATGAGFDKEPHM